MGETAAYHRLQSTSEEEDYLCQPGEEEEEEEEEEVYYTVLCLGSPVQGSPSYLCCVRGWVNLVIVSAWHLVL